MPLTDEQKENNLKAQEKKLLTVVKLEEYKTLIPKETTDQQKYLFGVARMLIASLNEQGIWGMTEEDFKQDLQYCLLKCYKMNLDPILKDIVFRYQRSAIGKKPKEGEKDTRKWVNKIVDIVTVDAMCKIAQRTGLVAGILPEYKTDKQGRVVEAITKVGRLMPNGEIAKYGKPVLFSEFDAESPFWRKTPANQLMKVSTVHALRLAFPEELGKLYTEEEMEAFATRKPVKVHAEVKKEEKEDAPKQISEERQESRQEDVEQDELPEEKPEENVAEFDEEAALARHNEIFDEVESIDDLDILTSLYKSLSKEEQDSFKNMFSRRRKEIE